MATTMATEVEQAEQRREAAQQALADTQAALAEAETALASLVQVDPPKPGSKAEAELLERRRAARELVSLRRDAVAKAEANLAAAWRDIGVAGKRDQAAIVEANAPIVRHHAAELDRHLVAAAEHARAMLPAAFALTGAMNRLGLAVTDRFPRRFLLERVLGLNIMMDPAQRPLPSIYQVVSAPLPLDKKHAATVSLGEELGRIAAQCVTRARHAAGLEVDTERERAA